MVNNIRLAWKLAYMFSTYITCNSMVGFLKYEFNNKLLDSVILFKVTSGITWTQLIYIYKIFFWIKFVRIKKYIYIQDFKKNLGYPSLPHPGLFDPLPLYPPKILSNYNLILQSFNFYILPIRWLKWNNRIPLKLEF